MELDCKDQVAALAVHKLKKPLENTATRTRTVKACAVQSREIFYIKQISVTLKEQINYP